MGVVEVNKSQYLTALEYISLHFQCYRLRYGHDEVLISRVWEKPVAIASNCYTRFFVCEKVCSYLDLQEKG